MMRRLALVLTVLIGLAALYPASAGAAPPVAHPDRYRIQVDTVLEVSARRGVLANDTDPDGGSLVAALSFGPYIGDLDLRSNGSFTYTPDPGAQGTDFFRYTAFDGTTYTSADVTIIVNGPATPVDDNYFTWVNERLIVPPPGVLGNDFDLSPQTLEARLVQLPQHGKASLRKNGRLQYVPRRGYNGVDTLTYEVFDGEFWSGPATVRINVKASNAPPVGESDSYVLAEDDPLDVLAPGVLGNDSDPDPGDLLTAELVSGPGIGDLEFRADGSFTYYPYPNFDSDLTFTYRVGDGVTWSDPIEIYIDMYAVNDRPVTEDDYFGVSQDVETVIPAPGVLANDSDPVEGDNLTATSTDDPPNGTLVMNLDGSFSYTPDPGYVGFDSFSYFACDPGGCTFGGVGIEVFSNE